MALDIKGLFNPTSVSIPTSHLAEIMDGGEEPTDSFTVTKNLSHCAISNEQIGKTSYYAEIAPTGGWSDLQVTIKVGGVDMSEYYSSGVINIPNVTGNIVITATAAAAPLTSITATYTQSGTVLVTDTLDSLRSDLVVVANYDNGTSATVTTYTLSGTLTAGTSTITVAYGGKTATFTVTVTDPDALPTGYTRYDYISNTTPASGGVDTGIVFDYCAPQYHHKIKFSLPTLPTGSNESAIYGVRYARYGGTWDKENTCWVSPAGVLRMGFCGSNNENLATLSTDTSYELETYHQAITLNGSVLKNVTTSGTYNGSVTLSVWLFGVRQWQQTPTTNAATFTFKIYSYWIKDENDNFIANFVPCTNNLGVAGFYDTVSQTFKTSAGSGSLTAGND